MAFDLDGLRQQGFVGFIPIRELAKMRDQIPDACGVYVAVPLAETSPSFLSASPAGWFKNEDPTLPLARVQRKWVASSILVYIGKAGPSRRRTLRRRISEFLDFGSGLPKPHRGGSAVWQLADSGDLLIAWKVTDGLDPRDVEKYLLAQFQLEFGDLPFANFKH